jgi:hypothetical protein
VKSAATQKAEFELLQAEGEVRSKASRPFNPHDTRSRNERRVARKQVNKAWRRSFGNRAYPCNGKA